MSPEMSSGSFSAAVRIGVLDSGITAGGELTMVNQAAFDLDVSGNAVPTTIDESDLAHGTSIAKIIAYGAHNCELLSAQVFARGQPGIPAVVAAGLNWLVEQNARIVNMSFGLIHDREVLRAACRAALARDVLLVASSPAQGRSVFPAAYSGVIRVTGDARCAPGELSWLGSKRADFGACVGGLVHRPHQAGGGASFAAAHFSGVLANAISRAGGNDTALDLLRQGCRYTGREYRQGTT